VVHFEPLKVAQFHPLPYAHFNPLRVVHYIRFLQFHPKTPLADKAELSLLSPVK